MTRVNKSGIYIIYRQSDIILAISVMDIDIATVSVSDSDRCDLIILSWFDYPVDKSSKLPGRRLVKFIVL